MASELRAVYRGPTGREVQLNDSDMLWAARGCHGESRGGASRELCAAFLWAMMRRLFLEFPKADSYGQLWINFSQPVNPIWRRDGWKCKPGGPYYGKPECREELLAYRDKMYREPWERLSATIRKAVEDFARGALPPPMFEQNLPASRRRITNWASYAGIEEKYPQGIRFEGEWFLQDANILDGEVEIVGVTEPENPFLRNLVGLGLGVLLGLGGLYAWRNRK